MKIKFDPRDHKGMLKLMKEHGNDGVMHTGTNEDGEDVSISVYNDTIIVVTYQNNGWVRKNFYYSDGSSEELFEGKWNK